MILFVSKNDHFVESVRRLLCVSEHEVVHVPNMTGALRSEFLRESRGLILDAPQVQEDEIACCQRIKTKNRDLRILVVSSELTPETELVLMEHGVDIYSDDPPNLFLAKIGKFKRMLQATSLDAQIKIGVDLVLEIPSQRLIKSGRSIPLPKKEFELLLYFCQHRGRALSADLLRQKVWDEHTDTERVRRYVAKLRQKIEDDPAEPQYLIHQRGVGYLFMVDSP